MTKKIVAFVVILIAILFSIGFFLNSNKSPSENFTLYNLEKFPIASGVAPHHLLAEELIEKFFQYIASKEKPESIILLSPDHFKAANIVGNSFITLRPDIQEFHNLKIDEPLIKNLTSKRQLIFSNSSVSFEHGITNLIPFVKKYFPNSKIVPFIIPLNISQEEIEQFAISLNSLAHLKTLVIASVDFSHYLPLSAVQFHDVKSIRTLINFEKPNFKNLEVDSWQALYIARDFAHLRKKEFPKMIGYLNSTDFLENEPPHQNFGGGGKDIEETTSYFSVVFEEGSLEKIKEIEKFNGKTVLFTGDIMLDRGVEELIQKNNIFYPFEKVSQLLRGVDIVVGNLEGPIVKNPPNFPANSLKFAFSPEVIEGLSFANFNLLSLANNHTFDTGKVGLAETKDFLAKAKINFLGHPIKCDKDFLFEKDNLIFLAFNKTFPFNCSDEEIVEVVKRVKDSNSEKFLIVIFHWGKEYHPQSSIVQQKLAHQIIEAGADLIIGAHSHVVQEIEEYKEKLIFYSLGNFIFDQYFSKATQQGLLVGLEIYPEKVVYRLFPIQSELSQPVLMKQEEAKLFLEKLAQKSSPSLFDKINSGKIEIER